MKSSEKSTKKQFSSCVSWICVALAFELKLVVASTENNFVLKGIINLENTPSIGGQLRFNKKQITEIAKYKITAKYDFR